MSKLKEHLTNEALKYNSILDAWEESYLSIKKIKDAIGLEIAHSDYDMTEITKAQQELMTIITGLEKHYAKNTKKVMTLSQKI